MAIMISAVIFATALLVPKLLPFIAAAPIQGDGRWVNPCGGSTPVSGLSINLLPPPPTQPITKTDLLSLQLMANTANSLSDEIFFSIKARMTTSVIDELESHDPLPGFPNTNAAFTSGIQIDDLLKNEITRVSEIGVFLEQARIDTYDYTDKIIQLENKYVEKLCKMHQMLGGQEVTSVSRTIMDEGYRNLHDSGDIDARNYLIIRDAKKIFVTISEGMDSYIAENNM